jgi:phage-related protein
VIGYVSSVVSSAWSRAVSVTVNGVNRAVSWFRQLPGRARGAIAALPGQIRGVFAGAAGWLVSAGADIVRGLLGGIRSMAGAVAGEARRIASNVVSGFRDALHIGSPSRVMANEVGRWIPPGILVGLEAAMPGLLRGVGQNMAAVTNAAVANGTGNFDFTSNGAYGRAETAPGGGGGMTLVLTVNGALDPLSVGRQIVTLLERWAASQGKHFELAT